MCSFGINEKQVRMQVHHNFLHDAEYSRLVAVAFCLKFEHGKFVLDLQTKFSLIAYLYSLSWVDSSSESQLDVIRSTFQCSLVKSRRKRFEESCSRFIKCLSLQASCLFTYSDILWICSLFTLFALHFWFAML